MCACAVLCSCTTVKLIKICLHAAVMPLLSNDLQHVLFNSQPELQDLTGGLSALLPPSRLDEA